MQGRNLKLDGPASNYFTYLRLCCLFECEDHIHNLLIIVTTDGYNNFLEVAVRALYILFVLARWQNGGR